MKRASIRELRMNGRDEAVRFLKRLWTGVGDDCPLCGWELEPLHQKAKKSVCDWQCRRCDMAFRTISLLEELGGQE